MADKQTQQELYAQKVPPQAADYAEDEINLLDILRVICLHLKMIITVVVVVAALTAGVTLRMTNIYRAEVMLSPVTGDKKAGGMSAALGNLGGLASLAGINIASGGSAEENLAVLTSREFLWKFVQDKKLMPILFADDWDTTLKRWKNADPLRQPGLWDAVGLLKKGVLAISTDKKTGLVTLAVNWKNPVLAAAWANELVARLNDYLRWQAVSHSHKNLDYLNQTLNETKVEEMRQTLFSLIAEEQKKAMLAETQKEFAFRVLDKAVAPNLKDKVKPKRSLIVLLSTFVAGFMAVLWAFVLEYAARLPAEDRQRWDEIKSMLRFRRKANE